MNVSNYLKQGIAWVSNTAIVKFVVRLTALCLALLVYVIMMSFMLTCLFVLGVYHLTIGQLKPRTQSDVYDMDPDEGKTNWSFNAQKLPPFPKW